VKTHIATNQQKHLKFSVLRFEGFTVDALKFSQVIVCDKVGLKAKISDCCVSIVRDWDSTDL
jgi:hypothetical protein